MCSQIKPHNGISANTSSCLVLLWLAPQHIPNIFKPGSNQSGQQMTPHWTTQTAHAGRGICISSYWGDTAPYSGLLFWVPFPGLFFIASNFMPVMQKVVLPGKDQLVHKLPGAYSTEFASISDKQLAAVLYNGLKFSSAFASTNWSDKLECRHKIAHPFNLYTGVFQPRRGFFNK